MKKISIIVPCFNEEETVELFYLAVVKEISNITNYEFEIIFVDDGSKDNTLLRLEKLSLCDPIVNYVSFSRNFGKEAAIFCGLKEANGDAVIVIDADLQHPVSLIHDMITQWENGSDVVEGIKSTRGKERVLYKIFSKIFYSCMSHFLGFDMQNTSDYKLLDRKVVNSMNNLQERMTFFRALSFWVGFNSSKVEYDVEDRIGGKSKWSSKSLIKYAIYNITSFTYAPLHLIIWTGVFVIIIAIFCGIDVLVGIAMEKSVAGYPTLVFLILMSTGACMLSMGVLSLYVSRMYEEIKSRPRYIVMKRNCNNSSDNREY